MARTLSHRQALVSATILFSAGFAGGCSPSPKFAENPYAFVLRIPGADLDRASLVLTEAFLHEARSHYEFTRGYPIAGHTVTTPLPDEPGVEALRCIPGPPAQRAASPCILLSREGDFLLVSLVDHADTRVYTYRIYVVSPFFRGIVDPALPNMLGVEFIPGEEPAFGLWEAADEAFRDALKSLSALGYGGFTIRP